MSNEKHGVHSTRSICWLRSLARYLLFCHAECLAGWNSAAEDEITHSDEVQAGRDPGYDEKCQPRRLRTNEGKHGAIAADIREHGGDVQDGVAHWLANRFSRGAEGPEFIAGEAHEHA